MTGYQKSIMQDTGCSAEEAAEVEDIMRDVVFHSTLDWQTREQFAEGARQAYEVLLALRAEST